MLDVIEKLLILQDRDRALLRTAAELSSIAPERAYLQGKIAAVAKEAEDAKLHVRQLESERKKLELEVEAKKQLIDKYSVQQFQTRKNDEYRALAHEIETCKAQIVKIEDQELELMEQIEAAQAVAAAKVRASDEMRSIVERQIRDLGEREGGLKTELGSLESLRAEMTGAVEEGSLNRYERLLRSKGDKVVVGVEHGVCGGCHMRLPMQVIVSCKAEEEIVSCPNCARILYYTRDMDLAVAD